MENNNENDGSRIRLLRKHLGLKQNEFCEAIGMGTAQGAISEVERGIRGVSKELLVRIVTTFPQVNIHWILVGEGEIERKVGDSSPVSEETKDELSSLLKILDEEELEKVSKVINLLVEAKKNREAMREVLSNLVI